MSKIRWSKEPYSSFRRATGSTEKAIELLEFMEKNEHIRRQIIREYYEI
jgi:hypothetical protein